MADQMCNSHENRLNEHEHRLSLTEGKLSILLKIDAVSNLALVVTIIIFALQSLH